MKIFLTKELLDFLGEDLMTAPASSMLSLHNAFPGGLIDHTLKTTKYAIGINKLLPENLQSIIAFFTSIILLP